MSEYNETYLCSDIGLILPLINESTWPKGGRIALYLIGLLWSFLAVSIIADIFMCGIETITSKTKRIVVPTGDAKHEVKEVEIKVWNGTVANLTLMALGTSAPEILLSIIEICGNRLQSGKLGPSTIVGSAAFNLFVISAVCIMCISSPEIRRIGLIKVFAVCSVFCVFVYIWLIIVLVLISPNYVELWEAFTTLMFFPLLVLIAYMTDKDYCVRKNKDDVEIAIDESGNVVDRPNMTHEEEETARRIIKMLGHRTDLTEKEKARLLAHREEVTKSHSRLWYRINTGRALSGAPRLQQNLDEKLQLAYDDINAKEKLGEEESGDVVDLSENGRKAVVEFVATESSVLERDGRVRLALRRSGRLDNRVLISLETVDGSAVAKEDYVAVKTTVVFEPHVQMKYQDIEIIDDNVYEPDEIFFVKIALENANDVSCVMGTKTMHVVTIVNDDLPGMLDFKHPSIMIKESAGRATIPVSRKNGADGKITVDWETKDRSAFEGKDYLGRNGTLTFEHGETEKTIDIAILDDQEVEKNENFDVLLKDPTNGATLGHMQRCVVTIINDDEFKGMMDRVRLMMGINLDQMRVDADNYSDQFRKAMNVNGGDLDNAGAGDYIMHFLSFGFKIIFACIPPPSVLGGWLTFIFALAVIAILTALIGDLASIFGCLIGLEPEVTAITFVALGTSVPDLFASMTAAKQEATADAAVGNVTGSNAINVMLGLGLPWLIASIYWTSKGELFEVRAGALSFSVIIYTIFAVLCLGMLVIRRNVLSKGELGGNMGFKIFSGIFLIMLWVLYVALSWLQTENVIRANF